MSGNVNAILALAAAGGPTGNSLVRLAPLGATMPTTAAASLDGAFLDPGYCHTDAGLVKAASQNSTDLYGVGTDGPLRTFKTQKKSTFALVFLETNQLTMAVYEELPLDAITVAGDGSFSFTEGPVRNQRYAGVFDLVDGLNLYRYACPILGVSEQQSLTMKNDGGVLRGLTFTAYPGSDGVSIHHLGKIPAIA